MTGDGRTLVGSGLVPSAEELRIVDPETRRPCAPNQIGEIWISGDHVGQGYCQRPELTADTFQARCAGESEPGYLRTGDLGVVIEGELYVVGRLKDMIIIRGSNYYPRISSTRWNRPIPRSSPPRARRSPSPAPVATS